MPSSPCSRSRHEPPPPLPPRHFPGDYSTAMRLRTAAALVGVCVVPNGVEPIPSKCLGAVLLSGTIEMFDSDSPRAPLPRNRPRLWQGFRRGAPRRLKLRPRLHRGLPGFEARGRGRTRNVGRATERRRDDMYAVIGPYGSVGDSRLIANARSQENRRKTPTARQ